VLERIISAVKRVEFVTDGMGWDGMGRWCHCSELYAPTEDETDDVKGSFYEEFGMCFP
jgi:hypothetical protein